MLIQVAGGVAWSAYELAFFLLLFESIPETQRTGALTIYNLANTLALVVGSLIGGTLLFALGTSYEAYLLLFGLSSVGRALAMLFFCPVPAVHVPAAPIAVRTVALRPNSATMDTPILPSLPADTEKNEALSHPGGE
jgi:MFS family permease